MARRSTVETVYKSEEGKQLIRDFMNRVIENWPVEHERFSVTAAGYVTEVIISGPAGGEPVILIHGSSSNMAGWMGELPLLSHRFRVIAVDIPGEPGLSDERRIPPGGGGPAAWLKGLLEGLGLESAHLVGMSLGGLYALLMAARYPAMVRSMTLLAPSGLAAPRASFIFRALPLMFLGDYGLKKINNIVSPAVDIPEAMFEFSRLTSRHYKPLFDPLPILSDEELAGLKMPILYYGGIGDALINTGKSAGRLERLAPHAEVNRLINEGHTIIGKAGEIADFIEKQKK